MVLTGASSPIVNYDLPQPPRAGAFLRSSAPLGLGCVNCDLVSRIGGRGPIALHREITMNRNNVFIGILAAACWHVTCSLAS
jgi:hypothetical protein